MNFTFPKKERICSKIIIDKLFSGGNTAMTVFPLRAIFMTEPLKDNDKYPVQVLISVSKRRMHHAVDRNRIKRQIREMYRFNKNQLVQSCSEHGMKLYIAFISLADEPCDTVKVEKSMIKLLRKTQEKINS